MTLKITVTFIVFISNSYLTSAQSECDVYDFENGALGTDESCAFSGEWLVGSYADTDIAPPSPWSSNYIITGDSMFSCIASETIDMVENGVVRIQYYAEGSVYLGVMGMEDSDAFLNEAVNVDIGAWTTVTFSVPRDLSGQIQITGSPTADNSRLLIDNFGYANSEENIEYCFSGNVTLVSTTTATVEESTTQSTTSSPEQLTTVVTSPPTTTNLEEITTPSSTTNVDELTTPSSTPNVEDVTTPLSTTNVEEVTVPSITTNENEVTAPLTTPNEEELTTPSSTPNVEDVTTLLTTTNVEEVTLPSITTNEDEVTTPLTTNNVEELSTPSSTINVEDVTTPPTTSNLEEVTLPSITTNVDEVTTLDTTTNVEDFTTPSSTNNVEDVTIPYTTTNIEEEVTITSATTPNPNENTTSTLLSTTIFEISYTTEEGSATVTPAFETVTPAEANFWNAVTITGAGVTIAIVMLSVSVCAYEIGQRRAKNKFKKLQASEYGISVSSSPTYSIPRIKQQTSNSSLQRTQSFYDYY